MAGEALGWLAEKTRPNILFEAILFAAPCSLLQHNACEVLDAVIYVTLCCLPCKLMGKRR